MSAPFTIGGLYSVSRDLADNPPPSGAPGGPARSTLDQLEARLDRQNLLIQTLLMLLLDKKVIEEDEFRKWRDYADQLDGRVDGKLREVSGPAPCPKCKRNNPAGALKCQYCETPLPIPVADPRAKPGLK